MKILDLIKKALKDKGMPEKYAERIQKTFKIEKEEDIEPNVITFKDNILPVIDEAAASATADYEKKHGLKDGNPVKTEDDKDKNKVPEVPAGIDPSIKALIEAQNKAIEDLKSLVQTNVKTVASAEKIAAAKKLVSDEKLPEAWASRVNVDSETSIEDQVKALKDEYTQIQQNVIDQAVANGDYTPGSTKMTERTEEEWTKLMNEDSKTGNPGVVDLGIK